MSHPPARRPDHQPAAPEPAAPPLKPVPAKGESSDVILVHSPTEDQQGLRVIRAHDGAVEAGEIRPVREGADLQGVEIVRLKEREGSPVLWDVDVQYDGRSQGKAHPGAKGHPGPARVTTRAYRQNYDSIFGPKQTDPNVN